MFHAWIAKFVLHCVTNVVMLPKAFRFHLAYTSVNRCFGSYPELVGCVGKFRDSRR